MERLLDRISSIVVEHDDLEGQVRPLLELLEHLTGLESTYLTRIDEASDRQAIVYARNVGDLAVPEGVEVPWGDTLCKRALDEGRWHCDDVAEAWGDSDAARDLGIVTYLGEPVRVGEGELYGTLCAASGRRVSVAPETRRLLTFFATLVARQIDRERLIERLRAERATFEGAALHDPLTGVLNRRGFVGALAAALANAARSSTVLHVAYLDLDGFKAVNDRFGHDVGDLMLREVAERLLLGLRAGDVVGRIGGDEFVVLAHQGGAEVATSEARLVQRIDELLRGSFELGGIRFDYAGPSVGVVSSDGAEVDVAALLKRADAAMYAVKRARRDRSLARGAGA